MSASNSRSNAQHEVPLNLGKLQELQTCRPVFNLKPLMRGPTGEVPEGLLSRNECIELLPRQSVHDSPNVFVEIGWPHLCRLAKGCHLLKARAMTPSGNVSPTFESRAKEIPVRASPARGNHAELAPGLLAPPELSHWWLSASALRLKWSFVAGSWVSGWPKKKRSSQCSRVWQELALSGLSHGVSRVRKARKTGRGCVI